MAMTFYDRFIAKQISHAPFGTLAVLRACNQLAVELKFDQLLYPKNSVDFQYAKHIWVCLKMLCTPLYPMVNDHYPYEKWL